MKSEAELRRMRAIMTAAINEPCECHLEGPEAVLRCQMASVHMQGTVAAIDWMLGEHARLDEFASKVEARSAHERN